MADGADAPRITFEKNGPIIVSGLETFWNSRGEPIRVRKEMRLCRCGHSNNKPFCDSTHSTIDWTDEKSDDRVPDALDVYRADGLAIRDNRGICQHAGFCSDHCPAVWRYGVEPWIDATGAEREAIIETIKKCPSGALSYEIDGVVHDSFSDTPEIVVSKDGPYRVRGGVVIDGVDRAEGASLEHCTLCRCGQSRNKPFCDGSHWYAAFKDDEAITIARAHRATQDEEEKWTNVGTSAEFDVDSVRPVHIGEKTIAVVRTTDGIYALNGRCPHQGGPLTEGTVCNGALRCPWHGYDFKLDTGLSPGSELVAETLKIREADGNVEIAVPQPKRSTWTVSHVIIETLVNWGIDAVFGMVGHSNLGLAEAIRAQEERGTLRYFGIRHEGAAAFACSGYAKVTGRPAACLSIAGPGATNLLTGLWDAKMDRAPVLALTGQVNTQVMGPGAFQEIDLASAFHAVARFSQTVLPQSKHSELASLAMKNAIVQRDVAHLIFPDEVQVLDAGKEGPGSPDGRVGPTKIAPPDDAVSSVLYRLGRAKRPVVIVGYGAKDDMDDVIALAEKLKSPIITTFKAKGQIADTHALGAGVLGRSGTPVASWFMNESDLLLVFGASFSDHTGITTSRPVVQVDFDRMQLGKFHGVDELVWGDIGVTARTLADGLPPSVAFVDQRPELADRWSAWRKEKKDRGSKDDGMGINSALLFEHLSLAAPEGTILPVDVGNNTYSFGRYFECKPGQSVIMSGYLGSIGFGFPAAMGAWAANTGRPIISVSGDGGFGQYLAEFTTAVKYRMGITHVLLNNSELGKISKEQRDGEWRVWQTDLHNPSFAEYAALCGGTGIRVERAADLPAALREAIETEGPALVEVLTDPLLT